MRKSLGRCAIFQRRDGDDSERRKQVLHVESSEGTESHVAYVERENYLDLGLEAVVGI